MDTFSNQSFYVRCVVDLICRKCLRTETEPYDIDDVCSCGGKFQLVQNAPVSQLEGIRVAYHYDENADEWVIRIHHPKGMMSVCGCPGEIEAKLVSSCVAAVIATADTTFSVTTISGGKTEHVACNNLVEYDEMASAVGKAIDCILDFIA